MGDTPLLESNASGTYKRMTIKKILLVEKKQKEILLLTYYCIPNSPVQHVHISYRS